VALVTPNALALLGVTPVAGRTFTTDDAWPSAPAAMLVSEPVARRFFGSTQGALGQTLMIERQPVTIIGVLHSGFRFPRTSDMWMPLAPNMQGSAGSKDPASDGSVATSAVQMFGRLKPSVDPKAVEAEWTGLAEQVPAPPGRQRVVQVAPFARVRGGPGQELIAFGVVGALALVLLVSVANVANLLLARSAARQRELAVRSALGASRARLMVSLGLEAVVLSVSAAVLGLVIARVALGWFKAMAADLPFWAQLALDGRVIVFAGVLTLVAALGAGLGPALRVTAGSSIVALREGSSGLRFGRLSAALVIVETAVAVGLLSGAAVLGRGLLAFGYDAYPFESERLLIAQLDFRKTMSAASSASRDCTEADCAELALRQIVRRLEAEPGVRVVATGPDFPGEDPPAVRAFEVEGTGGAIGRGRVRTPEISEQFFPVLSARLIEGRNFTASEIAVDAPVAIVNEPFIRKHLNGRTAIGLRLRLGDNGPWREIVGVAPDLGLNPGDPGQADGVYVPRHPSALARLMVLTDRNPLALAPLLHELARAQEPRATVLWSRTFAEHLSEPVSFLRFFGVSLFAVGGVALLLACTGIYAIIAFSVAQRRKEIAIRMAIGASGVAIVRSVLARSAGQLLAGAALGMVLGLALERISTVLPFAIERGGVSFLAMVGMGVVGTGVAACVVPLRRALAISPLTDLR
jgi:predicted permease